MKSVAVFNNKGGVGKTTLLTNLAAHLALKHDKKVLVIDADPQCNATQTLFQDSVLSELYDNKGSFTVDSIVRPLAQGRGYSKTLQPKMSAPFNVDVIPGDPRLALTEDILAGDWGQATGGQTRGLRTNFVFAHLLQRCTEYDIVFFDMGPSLGAINRAVLLGADYFLTPMSIDIFSLRAIDNISVSLGKWRKALEFALQQIEDNGELSDLEVSDPKWRLDFAGYVTQQYTAKRVDESGRRPVRAFDKIMQKIPGIITDLAESVGLDSTEKGRDFELGSIPNFHSLIPMSQTSRKPVFALSGSDGVVGAHFQKVKEFESIISEISNRLLGNIGEV